MDIPSYTSNIQPSGLSGGTNLASYTAGKEGSQQIQQHVENERGPVNEVKTVTAMSKAEAELTEQRREKLVENLNEFIESKNTGLAFSIDEQTGRDVVTIYDLKTGDLIRQFPSEDMLEILRRLSEHSTGLVSESV